MDQLRSLMQSALARRLAEHLQAANGPDLSGAPGIGAIPGLEHGLEQALQPAGVGLATLGLAREGIDNAAKALGGVFTGGLVGGQQAAYYALHPDQTPSADDAKYIEAWKALQGGHPIQANEIAAQNHRYLQGVTDLAVNPLNYLTGGGTAEARAAQQAGRIAGGLGLDLNTVNAILYPEGQLIGHVGGKLVGAAVPRIAGVLGPDVMGKILQARYNLPAPPIPGVTADAAAMARPAEDRAAQLLAALYDVHGPALPPEFGPVFPEKGNVKGQIGPVLPGLQDVPLPPELGPQLPERGNLPLNQLIPGVGRNGGRGIGPLLPGVQGPTPPVPTQDIADLLGAARKVAQPNRLEQLLGAARNVADRGSGILGAAKQASADLAPQAAAPATDTLGLMRDLLKSGDNGKEMVYAPADPEFWRKRHGIDPAAVPGLLRQLTDEGSLAPDHTGELMNTYLVGGDRTPVAPDMPGGSLELPDQPDYPNMTRAEAIGNLKPSEVAQLVELAYRNPEARKAALAKYANPADVASAALDRIEGNNDLMQNLHRWNPDLAGKLAYLPDFLTPQATPTLGQVAAQGGQNVLDWLLKSPVQGAPQISRLGIAGSGGVIGAAAGGLAPADTAQERTQHAALGGTIGAGLGLGATTRAGQDIIKALPAAKEFLVGGDQQARQALQAQGLPGRGLLGAANRAQVAAMDRAPKGIASFTNLANSWRVQQTSTVRNLLQDELTARLWNSNAGIRQQAMNDNWSSLVQLYNLGQRNGYDALPTQTTGLLDKWGLTGYMPQIGAGFNNVNESLIKDLSAADMAKMEAIFAGLNPAQGGIPLAGVALAGVKGYTRAWQEKIFSTLNEFTRLAARHAAFQDEFAPAMQVAAHDFVARHGATGALDPAAGFSAADVGQALGQQAQDEWAQQVEKVTHLAEQRALDIHGDFTRKAAGEPKSWGDRAANLFNTAVPFSSWALKAYPRTAQMMLDHPGVSLAIMLLTMGQAEKVQREGKAGLVGGIPITKDTPLVGGIAQKMLGNFPGEAYVNLLGSLTPISSSALLSPDQPVNANLYQQAGEALDRAGFSFNPLIQAAAYATNKDFQRPSPMSRTAGLEMALPGPDMPSLALGPLNAARKLAGGSEQHTTTEDRKLAELFYLSTGHQISDPSNVSDPRRAALLASTLDPNSPIRKLAAESTGQANVARNLVSLVSPVSLQAAPRVEQQAEAASYAARHAPPANYDPRTINALMNSGNMAQYIEAVMRQRANVGTQGEVSPLLQLTSQSSGQDRASMYLQALGASSIFGSPLVGAPQSLINQILGLSTPSVEIGGPQGGQR
jgi:hypothetical protein